MPRLALALLVVWFFSLFVARTVIQLRTTGSTGVKGFHGPVGSRPWLAGVGASAGLALAPVAPLAALLGWPGGVIIVEHPALHLAGAALVALGIAGALAAQLAMGESWRIGVDDAEKTQLVTEGIFRWVRNPIFSFVWVSAMGLVLLVPNVLSLLACALTMLGIELQVRSVEEPYLKRTHGDAYARYAAAVGRFVPGIGRLVDG